MQHKNEIKPNQLNSFRGQSLVEFVLLLPILLLLVFGALDVGRLFSIKIQLTNAAREGANYLSRHPDEYPDTANTELAIKGELNNLSDYLITNISCSGGCDRNIPNQFATITVESTVSLVSLSFFRSFGNINLSSTVKMMVQ
jgi:Flp pilus assembly protein TadG